MSVSCTGAVRSAVTWLGAATLIAVVVLVAQGKTDPYYHGIARAWQMEEEATHRAIMLAHLTRAPLYVVHVSAKQAVAQIAAAREVASAKGSAVLDISRLEAGQFYAVTEGMPFRKVSVPMCLSHHPKSALTAEEVLERARA